jgi:hypothetical protein
MALGGTRGRRSAAIAAALAMPAIFAAFPWMLTNAFSTNYLPHGFCFAWNPRLLWLHVVADAIIWLSYTAIAGTLALFVAGTRRLIRFQSIFFLFGTFIVACGFTHLLDVVVLWQPLYWLQGDLKLLTACASLITAVALPFCIPQVKAVLSQAAESAEPGQPLFTGRGAQRRGRDRRLPVLVRERQRGPARGLESRAADRQPALRVHAAEPRSGIFRLL